ncbi:unnamed protein product, partial [Mesorhabditis belari]|uniref:DOMON domain-containing protein n=1 Tax=Mesorhabditis belari TaxID=2138241 RepID=A0AAF3FAM4_9BILA
MILLTLIGFAFVSSAFSQCSYSRENVEARWRVEDGNVVIDFENSQLNNLEFTGIAFGDSMYNLEFILFKIADGEASVVTGATNGYGPPEIIDSTPSVNVESLRYNDGHLKARVSRPIGSNGPRKASLEGQVNWNFVTVGDIEVGDRGRGMEQIIAAHRSLPARISVDLSNC